MRTLVTGATGFVGSALIPRLLEEGHEVRAYARTPARVTADVPVVAGDVVAGTGLHEALDGIDVAYYLIHSMEAGDSAFAERERQAATQFVEAARAGGVRRIVYLGGPVPVTDEISPHLASRLEVERILIQGVPEACALRASIVIGARSRSFRFLVRLVERVPVLPLPPWRVHRSKPIDERDVLSFLVSAATSDAIDGPVSLDIGGPEVVEFGAMVERIRDLMLVGRPGVRLPFSVTPIASRVAAAIAGEDPELIGPLMGSLGADLLPRDDRAAGLLGVRLHSFDAAVEHALREWESVEQLAAR